jgi:chromosome segregation ATPase
LQSSNERRSVVSDSGSYEDTESEPYLQLDTVKILRLEQKFKKLETANSDLNEQAKTTTRKERELEERLWAIENARANSDSVAERFRVLEELVLSQAENISNLKAQLIEHKEDMERQRQLDMQEMQREVATFRSCEAQNTQRFEQMGERIHAVEKEKEAQTSRISSLSNRVSLQDTQRQEDRRPFIWEQNAAQT